MVADLDTSAGAMAPDGGTYLVVGGDLKHFALDGSSKTLVSDDKASIQTLVACKTTNVVLFAWAARTPKQNVWRVNADGTDLRVLTSGQNDQVVDCSRDGKFFIYIDQSTGEVFKMALEGGKAEVLSALKIPHAIVVDAVGISPDSKMLAVHETITPDNSAPQQRLVLLNLQEPDAKPTIIAPDPRISAGPKFSPDGKSLMYMASIDGALNAYLQPIAGSTETKAAAGKLITHFAGDSSGGCDYAPDQQHLGCVRVLISSNAILFHDTTGAK
jgi:Tol biopolymer transport system component